MLWKDSYKIGVANIDKQHYVLFYEIEKLIFKIQRNTDANFKSECLEAIKFLKEYVVYHFKAEEEYQLSIGYKGYKAHKILHEDFTNSVLEYEKFFARDELDVRMVKDFCGMLLAWLVHHVEDCDMRIATGKEPDIKKTDDVIEAVKINTSYVLAEMFETKNIYIKNSLYRASLHGNMYTIVDITGDVRAHIVFSCYDKTAMDMVNFMTGMGLTAPDEMVYSAMSEIAQIVAVRIASALSKENIICDAGNVETVHKEYDMNDNTAYANTNTIVFTTDYGIIEVLVKSM